MYFWFTVAVGEASTVIAHPGRDVELLCTVTPSGSQTTAWIINHVVYTVQQLHNGILTGYSSNGNNLIIENIVVNDDRNETEYECVTVSNTVSNPTVADIMDKSDPTILYVAGEYQYKVLSAMLCRPVFCVLGFNHTSLGFIYIMGSPCSSTILCVCRFWFFCMFKFYCDFCDTYLM